MAEDKIRAELTLALCFITWPVDGFLLVAFEPPLSIYRLTLEQDPLQCLTVPFHLSSGHRTSNC